VLSQAGLAPWQPPKPSFQSSALERPSELHADLDLRPTLAEARVLARSVISSPRFSPHTLDKILDADEIEQDLQAVYNQNVRGDVQFAASRFRSFMAIYLSRTFESAISGDNVSHRAQALWCRDMAIKELPHLSLKRNLVCWVHSILRESATSNDRFVSRLCCCCAPRPCLIPAVSTCMICLAWHHAFA
jgi:hypothetical protein